MDDFVSGKKTLSTDGTLILACSSDRGLCGAIHSSVSKATRKLVSLNRERTSVVVLGDKAKPQICRDARTNIIASYNQIGKNIPTFLDALSIWQMIYSSLNVQFGDCLIVYNRFVSAICFETVITKLHEQDAGLSQVLNSYEYEDATLKNYQDYVRVTRLYWALVEGHAAEMSSKRTAMENASKNADAIVVNLTMKYNRTRQAVITNELVDIITGAAAL